MTTTRQRLLPSRDHIDCRIRVDVDDILVIVSELESAQLTSENV